MQSGVKIKRPIIIQNTHTNPATEIEARYNNSFEIAFKFLFPIIAFLSIIVQSRLMAILIAILFILFSVGKIPLENLRIRLTPLTILVVIYSILCLAAGLYSDFGASAVRESAKILSAFALFSLVLVRAKKGSEKQILTVIVVISAIISFLCIDASSFKFFTRIYCTMMKLFLYENDINLMGYEQGVRITGIFCNPNISAGIVAFGVIISLYLVQKAKTNKKRFLAFLLLGINSLGFLLSFSLGAIAAFTLACIIFIIVAGKTNRLPPIVIMIETIIITVIISMITIPFLGSSGIRNVIPLMCSLICGPIIWIIHKFCGQRITKKDYKNSRIIGISFGTLLVITIVYFVIASNFTSGISLSTGDKLSRAEYLSPGEYSTTFEGNGAVNLLVYSQNEAQLMMHKNSVLYEGSVISASFTVPDDSRVTWFIITAQESSKLEKITLSNGTVLKLDYPLLPSIAANRMQGLLANQNFIQRLVFFKDGIKLFKRSPIIGSGLGSVEGRLTSVQSFYYESVYIHNHIIQVMDEMGLVGLVVFVIMILSAVILLWKKKKSIHEPILFATLSACLVLMIAHSLTEVVWSTGMYQSVVFLIFAVIIITCSDETKISENKPRGRIVAIVMLLVMSCFGLMICGNLIAANQVANFQPKDRKDVLSTMRKLDLIDVYDDEFYKATYIQNALIGGNIDEQMIATKYAKQLRSADEYKACTDVAMYYYLPKGMIEEMFDASRAAISQEASNSDAWNLQFDFYQKALPYLTENQMTEYLKGVTETLDYLEKYNKGRMEGIQITEQNQMFVKCINELAASDASDKIIFETLSIFSTSSETH